MPLRGGQQERIDPSGWTMPFAPQGRGSEMVTIKLLEAAGADINDWIVYIAWVGRVTGGRPSDLAKMGRAECLRSRCFWLLALWRAGRGSDFRQLGVRSDDGLRQLQGTRQCCPPPAAEPAGTPGHLCANPSVAASHDNTRDNF